MRRWPAVVCIAGALAGCGEKPGPATAPAAPLPAAEAHAASGPAPEPAPAPSPSGDRHARAAARRTHVVKRTVGKLARADDRVLVIGGTDATPPLVLRIAPGTAVTLDGRPAQADALPAGADVRAAYRTGEGGLPTAITVEARRPAGAVTPPAPAEEPDVPADGATTPGVPEAAPWQASPEPGPADGG